MAGSVADTRPAMRSRPIPYDPARLRRVVAAMPQPALLGGNVANGPHGRWAILAAGPRLTLESATGANYQITDDAGRSVIQGLDALEALDDLLDRFDLGQTHGSTSRSEPVGEPALPFLGGLIGFLSYDLAPRLERLPRRHAAAPNGTMPAVRFGLYDTFILLDLVRAEACVWAVDLLDEGPAALDARLDDWAAAVAAPLPRRRGAHRLESIEPEQAPARFRRAIKRAQEYLAAGDIFQVNLAQRFRAWGHVDLLALDDRLQGLSPAPYSATLIWDDRAILSASPELFYETRGRTIVTRPIKGTRPRQLGPGQDDAQIAALLASAKDAAELAMIVDLERNDLGRVCQFGTIAVVEPRAVESYSTVHHTVATVCGQLRPEVGPVDVVRALFPGGSITGAPKIRAMEIIDELEPCPRGVYTGAIGFWSRGERSSFNIAIRTIVVTGTELSYHVGGGIVIDSQPHQEYLETLHKGRALRAALLGPAAGETLR